MGGSHSYECTPNNTINVFLPYRASLFLYDDTSRIIITIVNPIILGICLLGNLSFLFTMLRIPRMKSITNLYLANLAVADIIFLSVATGEKLGRYLASPILNDQYPIGPAGCIYVYLMLNASQYAALYLITMVTWERYFAICKSVQHRLYGSRSLSIKLIIFGWFLALCFACALIPQYAGDFYYWCFSWPDGSRGGDDYSYLPELHGFCQPVAEWAYIYFNGMQGVPFLIALVVNIFMYVKIIQSVWYHTRVEPATTTNNNANPVENKRRSHRTKIRNQATRMLVINGVTFFVLVAPFNITSFVTMITISLENFVLTQQQKNMLYHVARTLLYFNSAVNPYIYTLINSHYRLSFKEAFCNCFIQKKNQDSFRTTVTQLDDIEHTNS